MKSFVSLNNILKFDTWSEFRPYIDGYSYSLSFNWIDETDQYRIITENQGLLSYEVVVIKDGGADQIDFEDNFKDLPPRTPGSNNQVQISGENNLATIKGSMEAATSDDPALVVAISPNNPITTSVATSSNTVNYTVASSTTNTLLLSSNSIRLGATIYNDSNSLLYINLKNIVSPINFTIKLFPLGYYEIPYNYTGDVSGIWSFSNGFARVTELTP